MGIPEFRPLSSFHVHQFSLASQHRDAMMEVHILERTVFVLLRAHANIEAHPPLFRAGDHWVKEIKITAIFKNCFEKLLGQGL